MEKQAKIYLYTKLFLLVGFYKTRTGLWLMNKSIQRIEEDSSEFIIGKGVKKMMDEIDLRIFENPARNEFKNLDINLLKEAGCKTKKEFWNNVIEITCLFNEGVLTLIPTENHGIKKGFKFTKHPSIIIDYENTSLEKLGREVKKAFSMSIIVSN